MIPNLQLLEGRQNESKNASTFVDWLLEKNPMEQEHFKHINYIPLDVGLDFKNFKDFFTKRKLKLKEELKKVLSINDDIVIDSDVVNATSLNEDIDAGNILESINLQ